MVNEKKYNKGIMVWEAIRKGWHSPLVLVKGKLNAQGYIDLLADNVCEINQLKNHEKNT